MIILFKKAITTIKQIRSNTIIPTIIPINSPVDIPKRLDALVFWIIPCEFVEELEIDWEVGDGVWEGVGEGGWGVGREGVGSGWGVGDGVGEGVWEGGGGVGGRSWDVQSCTFSRTCRDGPAPHAAVKPRVTFEDPIRDAISTLFTTKVVFIGVLFQSIVNVFEEFDVP